PALDEDVQCALEPAGEIQPGTGAHGQLAGHPVFLPGKMTLNVRVREGTAIMMLIACLARRLNPDVDYAAFRRAWIPDEIIDGDPRRRVLSGINLEDPRDLFTIAIIEDT